MRKDMQDSRALPNYTPALRYIIAVLKCISGFTSSGFSATIHATYLQRLLALKPQFPNQTHQLQSATQSDCCVGGLVL